MGMQLYQKPEVQEEDKFDINNDAILDTGATFSSFKNGKLLIEKRKADVPIKMRTNVGTRNVDKVGKLLGMNHDIWYDKKSMANIFSFGELTDK